MHSPYPAFRDNPQKKVSDILYGPLSIHNPGNNRVSTAGGEQASGDVVGEVSESEG
jgi:hypothetical protein